MPIYDFEVLEYHPIGKPAQAITHVSQFMISDQRLLIATVRSILSSRAPWAVRHCLASSVLPAMHFFVDKAQQPDFKVSNFNLGFLRDFSLTSRVGEFAQGITYAYWAFGKRAFVCDFVEWSTSNYPMVHIKSRPDFVVTPYSGSGRYVVEAKGTSGHLPTDQMRKALSQAKGVSSHPALTNGYGTVVTFDAKFGLAARIHIQDPVFEGSRGDNATYDAFRRHYASWYELAGNFERAAELRGEGRGDAPYRVQTDYVRQSALQALGMADGEFMIDPLIAETLDSEKAFRSGAWRTALDKWNSERLTDDGLDFPDGTAIVPMPHDNGPER